MKTTSTTRKKTAKTKRPELKANTDKKATLTSKTESGYPPFDAEAKEYMYEPVPGAYSRILYIGPTVTSEIAEILGRSITLEEAKCLVCNDGEPVVCAQTGEEFQPMKYLPFVPNNLRTRIEAGDRLADIQLPFGGAFYVTKDLNALALSGSVFRYVRRHDRYEWASGSSPMVIMAEEMGRQYGRREWGHTSEEVEAVIASMKTARERRDKIKTLAARIMPINRRHHREEQRPKGLSSVAAAFETAGSNGDK